jgi:1-acyl-sn-glycerol-3-phosphate acyltransferase
VPELKFIAIGVAAWVAFCLAARFVVAPWLGSHFAGNPLVGLLVVVTRAYCRLVHHVGYTGLERVPAGMHPGPLIVVANHTAGIDPLLIQIACRFEIRWMMSRDMMAPALDWFWKRRRMIPVEFGASDSAAVKEAIRHVKSGGVLGIFPEGGIERPARMLRPFMPGAGLIVARCNAPVLLAFIHGTPEGSAFQTLVKSSQSRVDFLGPFTYPPRTDAREIVEDLRRKLAEHSRWPTTEEPLGHVRGG